MRSVQRAIFVAGLLLLAPQALAAWGGKGAHEPDTKLDVLSGWMTLQPDVDPTGQPTIYFNGFLGTGGAAATSFNPNLARLNASIRSAPPVPIVLLGVWKDCNGDGFVGLGDNGALEYRSTLLGSSTICPVQVPTAGRPWATHNDGNWVVEFMPIGYDDVRTAENENSLNLNLTQTRVWADWGVPDQAPPLSCPLLPTPYGTFRSTGGLLRWSDCFTAYRGIQTVNTAAAALGQPGLGFEDSPRDHPERSNSQLNRQNPWGNENDGAIVRAFDCSRGQDIIVTDPTGQLDPISDDNGRILSTRVFTPAPALQPGGTAAGTVNETEAGLTDCDRNGPGEVVDLNGEPSGSDGDLPYGLEDGQEGTSPFSVRSRTDHAFTFDEGQRGTDLTSLALGARTREHGGIAATTLSGFWVSTQETRRLGADPYLSRESLGPAPVTHITFYAYVDPNDIGALGLRAPAGETYARYGIAACSAGTFECDPAAWWRDGAGRNVIPREPRLGGGGPDPTAIDEEDLTPIGVRVGALYNFRDVDCFDASAEPARSLGIHWGRPTSTACDRP